MPVDLGSEAKLAQQTLIELPVYRLFIWISDGLESSTTCHTFRVRRHNLLLERYPLDQMAQQDPCKQANRDGIEGVSERKNLRNVPCLRLRTLQHHLIHPHHSSSSSMMTPRPSLADKAGSVEPRTLVDASYARDDSSEIDDLAPTRAKYAPLSPRTSSKPSATCRLHRRIA